MTGKFKPGTAAVVGLATGALVLGIGGGAVGGALITSKQIKNNTIKSVDVKNGALTGTDVADGSLSGADVLDGSLTDADLSLTRRTHWIAVDETGVRDRGTPGMEVSRLNSGRYSVTLPTGVDGSRCGLFATRGRIDDFNGHIGYISASPLLTGDPRKVFVQTFAPGDGVSYSQVDGDFYLLVEC